MVLLGLRAVRADGADLGTWRAVVRTLLLPISLAFLVLAYLPLLVGRQRTPSTTTWRGRPSCTRGTWSPPTSAAWPATAAPGRGRRPRPIGPEGERPQRRVERRRVGAHRHQVRAAVPCSREGVAAAPSIPRMANDQRTSPVSFHPNRMMPPWSSTPIVEPSPPVESGPARAARHQEQRAAQHRPPQQTAESEPREAQPPRSGGPSRRPVPGAHRSVWCRSSPVGFVETRGIARAGATPSSQTHREGTSIDARAPARRPRRQHGRPDGGGTMTLEGKVAIVTGGNSGIGKAIALAHGEARAPTSSSTTSPTSRRPRSWRSRSSPSATRLSASRPT